MYAHEFRERERTVERFAWLPVRLDADGQRQRRWYEGWVHLGWYRSLEVMEPDYSGWSTGNWIRVGAQRLQ